MQEVSKKWADMLSDQRCRKEHRVDINGRSYTSADIVQLGIGGELYPEDTVSVGGTCAREIELTLRDPGDISRAARMDVYTRLVVDGETSEWIPKGVFRIATRQADATQNTLAINGFDRMLEAEQPFTVQGAWNWPMPMNQVADHIMEQLGWELDDRTVVTDRYTMELPVNGETCRDMLGWIAAASGGNWTITDQGKARLIRLRDAPETSILVEEYGRFIRFGDNLIKIGPMDDVTLDDLKDTTYIGKRASQVTVGMRHRPVTQVALSVSEEAGWVVGTDDGECIDVYCPDGTLQMANDLLAYLQGYEYQPVMATEAMIDPAAEMGDGATIENVFATIASMDVTFDALYSADIGAPGKSELESEYGEVEGPITKKFERQGDALRVQITKTEEFLTTKIQNTEEGLTSTIEQTAAGLRRDFEAADQGLSTTIEETAKGIRQTITDTKNDLSTTIETTASGIRKDFEAADTELGKRTTTIEETIDGITVSGEGGTTYIKPGAIQANSITGSMIKGGTITADDIETGSITASCLSFSVYDQSQTKSEIQSQITALKNGLTLTVTNNRENTSATLQLLDNKIELDSAEINLTGLVTVNALQTSGGGVTINGDNITAGKISGSLINGEGLNIADKFIVSDGNITIKNCSITLQDSSVTGGMLKDDSVTTSKINDGAVNADCIASDAVTSTKIAAGAVTAGKINAKGLRIGPSDDDIQFEVTETGQVNIKGNVKISGSISWDNVTGTSSVTNGITSAQNAASAAQSTANSASTAATKAANDVAALAGGTYKPPSFTFISEKQISSPTIIGGTIQGTQFYGDWFTVNSSGGGFNVKVKRSADSYIDCLYMQAGIYDSIPTATIRAPIMHIGSSSQRTITYLDGAVYLTGNIYFNDDANVSGIPATAIDGNITAVFA